MRKEKEEEEKWRARDPYTQFTKSLMKRNILTSSELEQIEEKADKAVKSAVNFCTTGNNDQYYVKQKLWPAVATLESGLRSRGAEFDNI